jgi:prefoldin subunit 5
LSLAPFLNMSDKDPDPTKEEALYIKRNIEVLQSQLLLLNAIVGKLDESYKTFLSAHAE